MPPAPTPPSPAGTSVVFGVATPYAWEIVETVWRHGRRAVCVDNIGGADSELPELTERVDPTTDDPAAVGPATPQARALTAQRARAEGLESFPALVDPTAVVAATSRVGHGAYVNALVSVGARSDLGCLVNLNRAASIGHHVRLGRFTATGPAAVVCGGVRTGEGVFLGAGSVVLPDREVGAHAVVGAGAVVTRDVPEGAVVVGNPARVVRDAPIWTAASGCPLC